MSKPKLQMSGLDGNAFAILARARRIALENNLDWKKIQEDAESGDYDHLIQVMMEHFEVS